MSYQDLKPQEDWVNRINENFKSQAITDTGIVWNKAVGVNGFNTKNIAYRMLTFPSGIRMLFISGWGQSMPLIKSQGTLDLFRIPMMFDKNDAYINVTGSVAQGDKAFFHVLNYNRESATISMSNSYSYDVSNFDCEISLNVIAVD